MYGDGWSDETADLVVHQVHASPCDPAGSCHMPSAKGAQAPSRGHPGLQEAMTLGFGARYNALRLGYPRCDLKRARTRHTCCVAFKARKRMGDSDPWGGPGLAGAPADLEANAF